MRYIQDCQSLLLAHRGTVLGDIMCILQICVALCLGRRLANAHNFLMHGFATRLKGAQCLIVKGSRLKAQECLRAKNSSSVSRQ
jgi:hypothetical protein